MEDNYQLTSGTYSVTGAPILRDSGAIVNIVSSELVHAPSVRRSLPGGDASSLLASEAISAAGATAPRVTLDSMVAKARTVSYFLLGDAVAALGQTSDTAQDIITICAITMANGFTVIGKSAPASAANFDAEKGRIFAYEDAIRQLWPLEGYALREQLSKEK